jgi:GMP synthase (glutamine-hydrolysing)
MSESPSAGGAPHPQSRPVLVVDFGAQYAQLIARRVREAGVYSEVVPHTAGAQEIAAREPRAIILSGGPSSVNDDGAPALQEGLLELGAPVFGICYGFQTIAHALGGTVAKTGQREYGSTAATVAQPGLLLDGVTGEQTVWMSHGDSVTEAPAGFTVLAATASTPIAAFEDADRRIAGVQWHPEVLHSVNGQRVLENFLFRVAGLEAD